MHMNKNLALVLTLIFFATFATSMTQDKQQAKMLEGIKSLSKNQRVCDLSGSVRTEFDDPPSIHGMVLFGTGPFYISHIPMFHKPHNYQAILEVEVDTATAAELLKSGERGKMTIVPERMVLPKVISEKGSFQAAIYDGHFEKQGKKIGAANLKIKRVVYFREFDLDSPKRKQTENYFLFGDSRQAYLAKEIDDVGPDKDELSEVLNLPSKIKKKISGGDILSIQNNPQSRVFKGLKLDTFYAEKDELK